jgi:hypothetical protein
MDLIKYRISPLLRERGIKGVRFHIKFALYFIHIPKGLIIPGYKSMLVFSEW